MVVRWLLKILSRGLLYLLSSTITEFFIYRKIPKISDTQKFAVITQEIELHPKDAEGIAKGVDPDQQSESALFAQTFLAEN